VVILLPHEYLPEHLYHGSTLVVESIDLSQGVPKKDFGQGFYTTTVKSQAEKFACIKARRHGLAQGFVSEYGFEYDAGTKLLRFERADVRWLEFVLFLSYHASGSVPEIRKGILR
jgi:hypothetical protein